MLFSFLFYKLLTIRRLPRNLIKYMATTYSQGLHPSLSSSGPVVRNSTRAEPKISGFGSVILRLPHLTRDRYNIRGPSTGTRSSKSSTRRTFDNPRGSIDTFDNKFTYCKWLSLVIQITISFQSPLGIDWKLWSRNGRILSFNAVVEKVFIVTYRAGGRRSNNAASDWVGAGIFWQRCWPREYCKLKSVKWGWWESR